MSHSLSPTLLHTAVLHTPAEQNDPVGFLRVATTCTLSKETFSRNNFSKQFLPAEAECHNSTQQMGPERKQSPQV